MQIESLLDRFLKTPQGQEIVKQETADQQRTRRGHVAALAAIDKRELAESPKLRAKLAAATTRRDAAIEALRIAQADFTLAHNQVVTLSASAEAQRAEHHRALEETASPCISEFIDRLFAERDRLRKESPTTSVSLSTSLRTLGERVVISNRDKLAARLTAIAPAVAAASALTHQDHAPDELEALLEQIWASLPDTTLASGG